MCFPPLFVVCDCCPCIDRSISLNSDEIQFLTLNTAVFPVCNMLVGSN